MQIIGKRSDRVYLVQVSDEQSRVLNLDERVFYPPKNTHSILKQGYWHPHTASADMLAAMLAQVTDMAAT